MRVIVANDHGAVERKHEVVAWLQSRKIDILDLGVGPGEKADYPDKAKEAVASYRAGGFDFGILLCGTGIGISIAANKMRGVRCALVHDAYTAKMAREHNDANFIAIGGRSEIGSSLDEILSTFVDSSYEGGRHAVRLAKIGALEKE